MSKDYTADRFIKRGGSGNHALMANGSTKPFSGSYSESVSSDNLFQNTALVPTLIEEMSIVPTVAGTFNVLFNGQFNTQLSNITQQSVIDLNSLFLNLNAQTVTNSLFPTFGAGTTIMPGVYETSVAAGPVGQITFDGGGNPDSIFIFRVGGAFTVGAACVFNLINGATPNNIFFVSNGAISLGANCNVAGTFISPLAAVGIGDGCFLRGRAFSKVAAITNNGNVYVPFLPSPFPMGIIANFAIFTAVGAVVNIGANIIVGDIGTNNGTITGFEVATLSGFLYLPAQGASFCQFSIYVDDVIVLTSTRERTNSITKDDVILSEQVTIVLGQTVSIKNLNSIGISRFYNRTLTITKI